MAVALALLVSALGTASASADGGGGLPTFGGALTFLPIKGAAEPESYSWQVELGPTQTLRSVSETEAEVDFKTGHLAFLIDAEKAHDADGTSVPTTLEVSEGDVITLVVHHREGTYVYPVTAGEGWTGGYREPTIIKGPPDESEIAAEKMAAEKRRLEEESPPAVIPPPVIPTTYCTVPALKGLSLHAAKVRLRAAHCSLGQVRLGKGTTVAKGKVVKQFHSARTQLGDGAAVAVKLGAG